MMEAVYVNPVLSACSSIIKTLLFQDIKLGELKLVKNHRLDGCIVIVIWMTGDFNGRFVFSMARETARKIASIMMGHELDALNDMGKSAIAEMSSMILGRSGILYADRNINVKISYPSMVEGDHIDIIPLRGKNQGRILRIPLIMNNGDVVEVRIEAQP